MLIHLERRGDVAVAETFAHYFDRSAAGEEQARVRVAELVPGALFEAGPPREGSQRATDVVAIAGSAELSREHEIIPASLPDRRQRRDRRLRQIDRSSAALVDAWIGRAKVRTYKHLREEVDAVLLGTSLSLRELLSVETVRAVAELNAGIAFTVYAPIAKRRPRRKTSGR